MTCAYFKDKMCVHPEAVKKFGKKPSDGGHKICEFNTAAGSWPVTTITVSAKSELYTAMHAKPELLGDKIEKLVEKWGLDQVAKEWEKITGLPCGCASRKAMINRAHEFMRTLLAGKSNLKNLSNK